MDTLIFMTVSASLLLLAAFALRALFGRVLPRRAFMALWCAASVRLLVPLEIALPVSVFALFAQRTPAAQTVQIPSVPVTTIAPIATAAPSSAAPVTTAAPVVVPAAEPLQFTDVLPWIWAAGAVLMASALLFVHLREQYRCRFMMRDFETEALVPHRVRVYRCAAVSAPYVTGLLRPQILLPAEFDKADLQPVLAHELAHIRGLDILKKMLFAAALCVNWFNPLVWVMVRLAGRDLELLCDERALREQDAPARAAYAHALLNAEERRSVFTLGFKSDTEVRIMNVLKGKKHNRLTALLSVLLVLLTVAACTSTPMAQETTPEPHSDATIGGADAPEAENLSVSSDDPIVALFTENDKFQFGDYKWGLSQDEVMEISQRKLVFRFENPDTDLWCGSLPAELFGYSGTLEFSFRQDSLFQIDFLFDSVYNRQEEIFVAAYSTLSAAFGDPRTTMVTVEGEEFDKAPAINDWYKDGTKICLTCDLTEIQNGNWQKIRFVIQDSDFVEQWNADLRANPTPTPSPEKVLAEAEDFKQEIDALTTQIEALEMQRDHYVQLMEARLEEAAQKDAYRDAAAEQLGEGATDYALEQQATILYGSDILKAMQEQIPNTEGVVCRRITVKRTSDDSVVGELVVPADAWQDYYQKVQSAFYWGGVYYSVTYA